MKCSTCGKKIKDLASACIIHEKGKPTEYESLGQAKVLCGSLTVLFSYFHQLFNLFQTVSVGNWNI